MVNAFCWIFLSLPKVSIAGEMAGVERARARVRELTPLLFNFDLPIVPSFQVENTVVVMVLTLLMCRLLRILTVPT